MDNQVTKKRNVYLPSRPAIPMLVAIWVAGRHYAIKALKKVAQVTHYFLSKFGQFPPVVGDVTHIVLYTEKLQNKCTQGVYPSCVDQEIFLSLKPISNKQITVIICLDMRDEFLFALLLLRQAKLRVFFWRFDKLVQSTIKYLRQRTKYSCDEPKEGLRGRLITHAH